MTPWSRITEVTAPVGMVGGVGVVCVPGFAVGGLICASIVSMSSQPVMTIMIAHRIITVILMGFAMNDNFIFLPLLSCFMSNMGNRSGALVLRETRKQFLMYYLFSILLVVWIVYLKVNGRQIVGIGTAFAGIVAFGGVLAPEAFRMWSYAVVTPQSLEVSSGILRRRHRRVSLSIVTDIHIQQHLLQRVLNYGTITVSVAGQQHFSLGVVHDPHDHVDQIDALRMKK